MNIILCILLFLTIICFTFVFFLQKSKINNITSKNLHLSNIESLYHELTLEKAKLEERCAHNEDIVKQYNTLLTQYSELEKKALLQSANLEQERKILQEKIKLLENTEQRLSDTFKAVSADALSKNNATFMDLAKSAFAQFHEKAKSEFSMSSKSVYDLVSPIKTALENVDTKLGDLEKSRIGAYEALKQQVGDLIVTQNSLKNETNHLVSALRAPSVRGRWGEMQLRRVVELAGMMEHCDFKEQVTIEGQQTNIRPDMIIYLPGNHEIIVDAKAPLYAYLNAINTHDDKQREMLLKEHAKQIRSHVKLLAAKKYWTQFEKSPEFVVLFLPGEIFFSVATEHDPSLIEFAMQERVIISTPTILLALLHTIALGWRHENLAEEAKNIINMGKELYKRLSDMANHLSDLGRSINSVIKNYNSTISSIENRVLVSARKFKTFDVHEKNIIELKNIETNVKTLKDFNK